MVRNCLSILLLVWVLSCTSDNQSQEESVSAEKQSSSDSVIVNIQTDAFSATFQEVNQGGKGSAEGESIFQRLGNLNYVMSELYGEQPVVLSSNPRSDQSYKVMMQWTRSGSFEAARDSLLEKLKEEWGYTSQTKTIKQEKWILSVVDETKLRQQTVESEKFNYKSQKTTNSQWVITATLSRFTEELSKNMNRDVSTEITSDQLYSFKLDLQGGMDAVAQQLANNYGLAMESREVSVQQVRLTFNNGVE
jgi:hypothetical protein